MIFGNNEIIAVDFDGTLCENCFPEIGRANGYLIDALINASIDQNCKIILWTCRVGKRLDEAVEWCRQQGLYFDAVNENLPEVIEFMHGDTRKIFANVYLDDRAVNPFLTRGILWKNLRWNEADDE